MKVSNFRDKLLTAIIFIIIMAVFIIFKLKCPFVKFLGIHCPGCGMTRAYINLFHFDFYNAFRMHPMFFTMPIVLVYYLKDWRLFKKRWLNEGILILILLGFIINWIVNFFI